MVLDSRLRGNDTKELIARVALLLGRLLQGEEPHSELFDTLSVFFTFLDSYSSQTIDSNMSKLDSSSSNSSLIENNDSEMFKTLESLIVIRILHRLGYVATIPELKEIIESNEVTVEKLLSLKEQRISMNQHINKALRESHL